MRIYYTDRFEGGRSESHGLLKEALSEYTGDAEKAKLLVDRMKTEEKGKPYIEGFDNFSISHTGSIWAVLIADCECGLDIQLRRKCNAESIAKRIFAPEDCAIFNLDEQAAMSEFFRLWTRREALVKAVGGSVCDSGLPSAMPDKLTVDGTGYVLEDISVPEFPHLYAAMCLRGDRQSSPVFIKMYR